MRTSNRLMQLYCSSLGISHRLLCVAVIASAKIAEVVWKQKMQTNQYRKIYATKRKANDINICRNSIQWNLDMEKKLFVPCVNMCIRENNFTLHFHMFGKLVAMIHGICVFPLWKISVAWIFLFIIFSISLFSFSLSYHCHYRVGVKNAIRCIWWEC